MSEINSTEMESSTETCTTKIEHDEEELLENTSTAEMKNSLLQKLTEGASQKVTEAIGNLFEKEFYKQTDFESEDLATALKDGEDEKVLEAVKAYTELREKDSDTEKIDFAEILKSPNKANTETNVKSLNGPDTEKIEALLKRTTYKLEVTSGQRRYGGPPPKEVYDGEDPGPQCQVFVGKIPKNAYEDELIPLLEKCGIIWDFRLMIDPLSGKNRGFGFCSYTTKEAALKCVKEVDNHEIRFKKQLGVCLSQSNCRLFVGSIPKTKTKDQIFEEFNSITQGLKDVIVYLQTEDKNKNRGFCFLEFVDHKAASQARRKLSFPKTKAFKNPISVDWADPIEEPSDEIMSKVKVLYVKNLALKATEDIIKTTFSKYGQVDRVKKIKDYAFVHFKERADAMKALEELNGENIEGEEIEITLAKPIDRKKRERQMERKMLTSFSGMGLHPFGVKHPMPMGGRNGRNASMGMGFNGPMPSMGFAFSDEFMQSGYVGYEYGGYGDQQFYGMAGPGPMVNYRGRGKRGMFPGGPAGRGRGGRGGRGGPKNGNWGRGGRGGSGNMNGKRKPHFENGNNFKRKRFNVQQKPVDVLNDSTTCDWGSEPIVQQPLGDAGAAAAAGEQWF